MQDRNPYEPPQAVVAVMPPRFSLPFSPEFRRGNRYAFVAWAAYAALVSLGLMFGFHHGAPEDNPDMFLVFPAALLTMFCVEWREAPQKSVVGFIAGVIGIPAAIALPALGLLWASSAIFAQV